jgi:hypothetical protein
MALKASQRATCQKDITRILACSWASSAIEKTNQEWVSCGQSSRIHVSEKAEIDSRNRAWGSDASENARLRQVLAGNKHL